MHCAIKRKYNLRKGDSKKKKFHFEFLDIKYKVECTGLSSGRGLNAANTTSY